MLINQNGAQQWSQMLKENFNVKDQDKLNWVSQYAAIHEIHESNLGVNAGNIVGDATAHPGVGPVYATPLNTTGMGNPYAPENPNVNTTMPGAKGNMWNQGVGSGDIPVSTLPMALNVALMTIGLELVPVVPATGPWVMLSYMDFPYAGGKLGRVNETVFDGKGDKNENKPIYVKVLLPLSKVQDVIDAKLVDGVKNGTEITVTNALTDGANKGAKLVGTYMGLGRNDAGIILLVKEAKAADGASNASITEVFDGGVVTVTGTGKNGALSITTKGNPTKDDIDADDFDASKWGVAKADFVQTSADLVDGFANFATGAKDAMTRAQNETGTGNTIGLRLFSKWVQVGSYEVTGTVTRQQLQDLPLYGVDAVGKVMEALQNELTQHINQRILERVFRLGVTNAVLQKARQGVDLNLYLGTATSKDLDTYGIKEYTDIYGGDHMTGWTVANQEALTSAENTHTRQRRIASRVLAAANLIQTVGRRGRASWIVTNAQVASALQDVSGYVVAPMTNNLAQDGSQNLFLGGTLAGLKVYVDPYMDWDDTRICVGRKGDANSPGVVFMPYILADTISITAEGTMAPKMLVNSRFAIAEIGFYPELQYYTFAVASDFGLI